MIHGMGLLPEGSVESIGHGVQERRMDVVFYSMKNIGGTCDSKQTFELQTEEALIFCISFLAYAIN